MIYRNPLARLINASLYSLHGLFYAIRHEQAFRYECAVFAVICVLLCVIPLGLWHKIFLASLWVIVMALELVNSSTEKAFDLITEDFRPEIKAGKDMLSAAVFLMVCVNIIVWIAVIVSTYTFLQAG